MDNLRQARAIAQGSSDKFLTVRRACDAFAALRSTFSTFFLSLLFAQVVLVVWILVVVAIAAFILVPYFRRILRDAPSTDRANRIEL